MLEAARSATIIGVVAVTLISATLPADARGHGFGGHGIGMRGAQFAADRRHGNDAYVKAASEERDKLLNAKIKSICRGCRADRLRRRLGRRDRRAAPHTSRATGYNLERERRRARNDFRSEDLLASREALDDQRIRSELQSIHGREKRLAPLSLASAPASHRT